MAKLEKVTFELTSAAVGNLRKLKSALEQEELAVKQRDIVEFLLLSATLSQLRKHFDNDATPRIGVDQLVVRERRKAYYKKRKTLSTRKPASRQKRL